LERYLIDAKNTISDEEVDCNFVEEDDRCGDVDDYNNDYYSR